MPDKNNGAIICIQYNQYNPFDEFFPFPQPPEYTQEVSPAVSYLSHNSP